MKKVLLLFSIFVLFFLVSCVKDTTTTTTTTATTTSTSTSTSQVTTTYSSDQVRTMFLDQYTTFTQDLADAQIKCYEYTNYVNIYEMNLLTGTSETALKLEYDLSDGLYFHISTGIGEESSIEQIGDEYLVSVSFEPHLYQSWATELSPGELYLPPEMMEIGQNGTFFPTSATYVYVSDTHAYATVSASMFRTESPYLSSSAFGSADLWDFLDDEIITLDYQLQDGEFTMSVSTPQYTNPELSDNPVDHQLEYVVHFEILSSLEKYEFDFFDLYESLPRTMGDTWFVYQPDEMATVFIEPGVTSYMAFDLNAAQFVLHFYSVDMSTLTYRILDNNMNEVSFDTYYDIPLHGTYYIEFSTSNEEGQFLTLKLSIVLENQ